MEDFYKKYQDNINSLAKAQNVDLGVAQNMFLSNVTGGQKFDGAGQYNSQMTTDANNYLNSLKQTAGTFQQQADNKVNSIYDAQQNALMARLQSERDKATGQINQNKAEIKPMYANKRNQADVVNMQNVQRLREAMANAGLTGSGENVTAQVGLAGQRQSSLNNLNLQEQQEYNDMNRRLADLYNPNDVVALQQAIEAEKARGLLDSFYKSDDRNFRNAEFDYRKLRDSVGDSQWQKTFDMNNTQWQQQFEENVRQFGLQYALQKLSEQNSNSLGWANYNQRNESRDTGTSQQQQLNEGMYQAIKLAQGDPRVNTFNSDPNVFNQIVMEYYNQLTGSSPSIYKPNPDTMIPGSFTPPLDEDILKFVK